MGSVAKWKDACFTTVLQAAHHAATGILFWLNHHLIPE